MATESYFEYSELENTLEKCNNTSNLFQQSLNDILSMDAILNEYSNKIDGRRSLKITEGRVISSIIYEPTNNRYTINTTGDVKIFKFKDYDYGRDNLKDSIKYSCNEIIVKPRWHITTRGFEFIFENSVIWNNKVVSSIKFYPDDMKWTDNCRNEKCKYKEVKQ